DLLIRQDRLEEAGGSLRQALRAEPQNQGANRRLGMVLERLGQTKEAQAAFESALRINPNDATAHLLLGRTLLNQGLVPAAKVEFEQACRLNPHSAGAFYGLFQVQTKLGESDNAQQSLETFRELKKHEKSAMDEEDGRNEATQDLGAFAADFHDGIANLL